MDNAPTRIRANADPAIVGAARGSAFAGPGRRRRVRLARGASMGLLTVAPLTGAGGQPRPSPAHAIEVGRNVLVSGALPAVNHHEVVMAAHPATRTLLACSMLGDAPGRRVNAVAYRSDDGGATWALATAADEYFAGDPTCAFALDGTAYFVTKTNTGRDMVPGASSDTDSLHIRRSRDGGATWDPVVHSIRANDRPFIAVDTTRGARRGTLYVAYDDHVHGEHGRHGIDDFRHLLVLAASRDGGAMFPVASSRALLDQRGDTGHASLAAGVVVLSTGTVAVLQHHMLLGASNAGTGKLRELGGWLQVFTSHNGAHALPLASRIATVVSGYNDPESRGVTGAIAADPGSERYRDRIYVAWTDFSTGRGIIRLTSSTDEGRSWREPIAIGEDRTVADPNGAPDNFMPALAVNRDGVVGITWYDRRAHLDNAAYTVRFTASVDGGDTWLESVVVATAPNAEWQQRRASRPEPSGRGWRPAPGTFVATGGDTAGLAASADGRFHAVWIDNRTGVQQVWSAPIVVKKGSDSN